MFVANHRARRVQTCLCPAGADLRSVCPSAAGRRTHLSSSSAGWRSQPAAAQLLRQWDRRHGWRWSCSLLLLPPSGLGSPAPAARSACTAGKKRDQVAAGGGRKRRGRRRRVHLGELGHQRAVLQPEVLLLAVQLPLEHLRLTQQSLHLLQEQQLAISNSSQQLALMLGAKEPCFQLGTGTHLSFPALVESLERRGREALSAGRKRDEDAKTQTRKKHHLLGFEEVSFQDSILLTDGVQL